eukprot:gene4384-14779_t
MNTKIRIKIRISAAYISASCQNADNYADPLCMER